MCMIVTSVRFSSFRQQYFSLPYWTDLLSHRHPRSEAHAVSHGSVSIYSSSRYCLSIWWSRLDLNQQCTGAADLQSTGVTNFPTTPKMVHDTGIEPVLPT